MNNYQAHKLYRFSQSSTRPLVQSICVRLHVYGSVACITSYKYIYISPIHLYIQVYMRAIYNVDMYI